MSTKPRALARRGAQALTMAAMVAGGVAVASPAHAVLPVPTITSVFVAGSTTNKVVTAGTTVVITGTGFTGMTDNAAVSGCSTNVPVAYPTTNSGCSQVRFLGIGATNIANFTLSTRYTVLSDTQIIASVPAMATTDGATGGPVAGTGAVTVQVLNTTGTGTSSLLSASAASGLIYRKPLTATIAATPVYASPVGGGALTVPVSGGIAALTSGANGTLAMEKITAYVYSVVASSPQVAPAAVNFLDATNVSVVLPPGSPAGDFVGIMLVHDGIPGTADVNSLKYPAVITSLASCSTTISAWIASPTATLPVCTGSPNVPATGGSGDDAWLKITGKGFAGSTVWNFEGADGDVDETCVVVSDTLAYCALDITTAPTTLVAPREIIRPISTDKPLKASVPAPGK